MTKLNKTQRCILETSRNQQGLFVISKENKLQYKQAMKLVDIGILTHKFLDHYQVETFDEVEIYELLVMYRAKQTGKLARQHQGRYHCYVNNKHFVIQYVPETKQWVSASINGVVGGFKTLKLAYQMCV